MPDIKLGRLRPRADAATSVAPGSTGSRARRRASPDRRRDAGRGARRRAPEPLATFAAARGRPRGPRARRRSAATSARRRAATFSRGDLQAPLLALGRARPFGRRRRRAHRVDRGLPRRPVPTDGSCSRSRSTSRRVRAAARVAAARTHTPTRSSRVAAARRRPASASPSPAPGRAPCARLGRAGARRRRVAEDAASEGARRRRSAGRCRGLARLPAAGSLPAARHAGRSTTS